MVLTNKDRNASLEIPCSLLKTDGLKDYKLSGKEMRDPTEYILEKYHENVIHVEGLYTDGQWKALIHLSYFNGNCSKLCTECDCDVILIKNLLFLIIMHNSKFMCIYFIQN